MLPASTHSGRKSAIVTVDLAHKLKQKNKSILEAIVLKLKEVAKRKEGSRQKLEIVEETRS